MTFASFLAIDAESGQGISPGRTEDEPRFTPPARMIRRPI